MFGEGVAPLTQERQVTENPCCDCERSGMSMTCRCEDRNRYLAEQLNKFGFILDDDGF